MKKWIKKILFPPISILIPLSGLSVIVLLLVFCLSWKYTFVAYVCYVCSAYAFTVWCIKGITKGMGKVSAFVERFPLLVRYQDDLKFKAEISICLSFVLDVAYAFYKVYLGAACRSLWLGSVASYHILLGIVRFSLLWHISKRKKDSVADVKRYRSCGYCLLILTFILTMLAYTTIRDDAGSAYPGHLIYVTAGYTFYKFYSAIHNIAKYRKLNIPVISASKCISLACALVSIFTLQAAMLLNFGKDTAMRHSMNVITAAIVFTGVLLVSLVMIMKASVDLTKLKTE